MCENYQQLIEICKIDNNKNVIICITYINCTFKRDKRKKSYHLTKEPAQPKKQN